MTGGAGGGGGAGFLPKLKSGGGCALTGGADGGGASFLPKLKSGGGDGAGVAAFLTLDGGGDFDFDLTGRSGMTRGGGGDGGDGGGLLPPKLKLKAAFLGFSGSLGALLFRAASATTGPAVRLHWLEDTYSGATLKP